MPEVVTASDIRSALSYTPLTARALVRKLMTARPVDARGRPTQWPMLKRLTVGDLTRMGLVCHAGPEPDVPLAGLDAACFAVADAVAPVLHAEGHLVPGVLGSREFAVALHAVTTELLASVASRSLSSFVWQTRDDEGFYARLPSYDPAELDGLVAFQCEGQNTSARVVDAQPFEGMKLTVWRNSLSRPSASTREELFDIFALLQEPSGQPAAVLTGGAVFLPRTMTADSAAVVLDDYGLAGLTLGASLFTLIENGELSPAEVFDGKGLFHLQHIEVRHDLRGIGLGQRFLARVLPDAVHGLPSPVNKLAFQLAPAQVVFPVLDNLPPEFVLEARQAVESLYAYVERLQPQSMLPVRNGRLIYLDGNPRRPLPGATPAKVPGNPGPR